MPKNTEIEEISLLLTRRCNFNCPYCYIQQKEEDMDEETGEKGIDLLLNSKGHNKTVHFFGGEPLLKFNLILKLSEYAKNRSSAIKKNIKFKITTNGSLIDSKIKKFLKEKNFEIVLSFHENDKSSFSHIEKNKEFFQNYSNLKTFVVSYPPNLERQFSTFMYAYKNKLAKKLILAPATGYPWDEKSVNKLDQVYSEIIDFYFREGIKNATIENLEKKINPPVNRFISPFKKEILILPSGDIILCNFLLNLPKEKIKQFIVGNIKQGINKKYDRFPLDYCNEECSKYFFKHKRPLAKKEICFLMKARSKIGEIISRKAKKYLLFPSFHLLTLTEKCSQNCIYCYAKKGGKTLDERTAKKIVSFIFRNSPKNLNIFLQGNEPLLNFEMVKKITCLTKQLKRIHRKQRADITLFSNLSDMDEEKLDFILKNNISVHTSLDGPKELHEKNRQDSSFNDLQYWIKKIKDKGINLNAAAVITKDSLPKFKEIIDTYRLLNINKIALRSITPLELALKNWKEISYTPEQFLDFWKNSLEYIFSLNEKGIPFIEEKTMISLKKVLGIRDMSTYFSSPPCSGMKKQVAYDTEGNIYPCDETKSINKFKMGNVNSTNLILRNNLKKLFSIKSKNSNMCFALGKKANEFKCRIYENQIEYLRILLKYKKYRRLFRGWLNHKNPAGIFYHNQ